MSRLFLLTIGLLTIASVAFADDAANPVATTTPGAAEAVASCRAKMVPLLRASGGVLTPQVRQAYLNWADEYVTAELSHANQAIPDDCRADVNGDATSRDAVFGGVFPPDPSILQNYAELRQQLGSDFATQYHSLVVGMAVARRTKSIETGDDLKNIGRYYQPVYWRDTALKVPGTEAEKDYVRHIADFMSRTRVSAFDLYVDDGLQDRLRAYLAKNGVANSLISEVRTSSVPFGERLKYALVDLGQRPSSREARPSTVDWIRHLAAQYQATPASIPAVDGKPVTWPIFPLDSAPWPLLMPLVHSVPLSEAGYIWDAYQGNLGADRYHSYGPYNDDAKVMLASLQPSKWFWGAWPDRIVHGGECVELSLGTVDFYSGLGKPATWAGQPAHCNLISFQHVDGTWTAEIEQAFAGGPDQTSAGWYFDEDPGMPRFRDLAYWPGAEYHLGLALAMNVGLKSYMDTRIAANLYRILADKDKPTLGVTLLRSTLAVNPYNPEIWYRLAEQVSSPAEGIALTEAALHRDPARLSNSPDAALTQAGGSKMADDQYWQTLAEFVAQYALLSHGDAADLCNGPTSYHQTDHKPPTMDKEMRTVYNLLRTVHGLKSADLTPYFEAYLTNESAVDRTASLQSDLELAGQGDPYGLIRMGTRYRDGDGVAVNIPKAIDFLAESAKRGDVIAAGLLERVNPVIPTNMISVSASSVYNPGQAAAHLINGAGMTGWMHDNEHLGSTMWFSTARPGATPPAQGLPASPAWVRFDFSQPSNFEAVQIWNENQDTLTARGFHLTRIYGTTDGVNWTPLTSSPVIELPRADGSRNALPVTIANEYPRTAIKAVIIAAEAVDGNYGDDYYGLSAVRFVVHRLPPVIPADAIKVTASSMYPLREAAHLIDGSGMLGAFHDNSRDAYTMWVTAGPSAPAPPAKGLAPSPAWVRFDFSQPRKFNSLLIWNENQEVLTVRSLRKVRIYGSSDGTTWQSLTSTPVVELPRSSGHLETPNTISNMLSGHPLKSVIIAAEAKDGNYGDDYYGLSAVRFVTGF